MYINWKPCWHRTSHDRIGVTMISAEKENVLHASVDQHDDDQKSRVVSVKAFSLVGNQPTAAHPSFLRWPVGHQGFP